MLNTSESRPRVEQKSSMEWDILLGTYLRPLKSRNARKIFQIILEHGSEKPLTTLDIGAKLGDLEIKLDKKEINGWLSSLLEAGLITKEKDRGKPTTLRYDNRYTFDLWRITDLGTKIAEGLSNFTSKRPSLLEEDIIGVLKAVEKVKSVERNEALQRINEIYVLVKALKILSVGNMALNSHAVLEGLKPSPEEIDQILSSHSNRDSRTRLFERKRTRQGFTERFRNMLGLPSGSAVYSLTEEGVRIAKSLF